MGSNIQNLNKAEEGHVAIIGLKLYSPSFESPCL